MKKYITPDIEILSFNSEDVMVADASVVVADNLIEKLFSFNESVQIETASNGYNGTQID